MTTEEALKLCRKRLRIAYDALEELSQQSEERYPGAARTFAEDALIQISVAEIDDD